MLNLLKVYGIDMERCWVTVFFKLVYFVIEFMSIAIVSYSFYLKPMHQMHVVNILMIVSCVLTRQAVSNNEAKVIDLLQQLSTNLDSDMVNDVKMVDRLLAIAIGLCHSVALICGLVSTFGYQTTAAIEIGLNIYPVHCSSLIETVVLFGYLYHFYMIVGFICFYCMVQYVFVKHAQACGLLFAKRLQTNLNETELLSYLIYCQSSYKLHLMAKRQVNKLIGLVPFILFSSGFIHIVVTISYMIVNEQSIPKSVLFLVVLPAMVTNVAITMLMVRFASSATDEFQHARLIASYIAIDSVSGNTPPECIQKQMKSLFMLISVEKPICATAWDIFDINRQLTLHFTNAVIPFAVMIITASLNRLKLGFE